MGAVFSADGASALTSRLRACSDAVPMYGIDFGTSNTVVTFRSDGGTGLLDLGEGGILPSLLYFERDRRPSVGREAMADYAAALQRWKGKGELYSRFRFFQAIKLALKDPWFEGTRLFGERVRVEALAAIFLREVKRRADEATGGDERRLVLGRPVVLSTEPSVDERLEGRFREAALLAGFEDVAFVLEPIAACANYAGRAGETVLVFDFGGGTLDVCIARVERDGIEVLASTGADLGGYLINEDIARSRIIGRFGAGGKFRTMTGSYLEIPGWIANQVASFYALPLADLAKTRATVKDLIYDARPVDKDKLRGLVEFLDRNLAFELFNEIDEAKIALSTEQGSAIAYAIPPYIEFREELTRPELEALIEPRVISARSLVESALAAARLEAGELDRVVRVGGSSRIPAFTRMLETLFPGRVEEGAVFTSIASGLLEARDRGLQVPRRP
jgi:hypothetical chaperone protein